MTTWDQDLVQQVQEGRPGAFSQLVREYEPSLKRSVFQFLGDADAAADVTQDVFLKLLDRYEQFRGEAAISTWLYRVVVNAFLDHCRARRPWLPLAEAGDEEETPTALLLPPTQEDDAERRQRARAVQVAVAELGPRFRVLVVLRYSAGLSYEEIAEVLDVSPGTVASRLHRAHGKLARKLAVLQDG